MITSGFIGCLVTGVLGAVAAALAVFATSLLLCTHRSAVLSAFRLRAAGRGVCSGGDHRGRRTHTDKEIPEPLLIVAAGVIGTLLHGPVP